MMGGGAGGGAGRGMMRQAPPGMGGKMKIRKR